MPAAAAAAAGIQIRIFALQLQEPVQQVHHVAAAATVVQEVQVLPEVEVLMHGAWLEEVEEVLKAPAVVLTMLTAAAAAVIPAAMVPRPAMLAEAVAHPVFIQVLLHLAKVTLQIQVVEK